MIALGAMTLSANAQATGSLEAPLSVTEFLAQGIPSAAVADTYVQGYIVGWVDGQTLSSGARFDLTGTVTEYNILLAASSSEDNVEACIPVQLPSGSVRNSLNLAAHPENLYHEVILCGSHDKYFGANGLKSVSTYQWVGEAPTPSTEKPGVDVTGTKEAPLTVTKYLELGKPAAAVADTWLTGIIVGSITDKSIDTAEMGASANSSKTNILVAATANPTSVAECIPVQLPQGDIRSALNLAENPGNVGKTVLLCGSREAYFGVTGMKTPTFYSLDGSTTPEPPVQPAGQFYKGLESNADDWTLNVGELPEGLSYVWAWDSTFGLKASAYVNKVRYETEMWAVSPVIDLTNAKTATLKLSQAANFLADHYEYLVTAVKVEDGEWETITLDPQPSGNSWAYVDSSASLDEYAGKKIQVGFKYISTTVDAATWEIKNMVVSGETTSAVAAVAAENVYVSNGSIVAPEGARAFNLNGVETGLNNLPAGVYVVVVADKAVKVLVK